MCIPGTQATARLAHPVPAPNSITLLFAKYPGGNTLVFSKYLQSTIACEIVLDLVQVHEAQTLLQHHTQLLLSHNATHHCVIRVKVKGHTASHTVVPSSPEKSWSISNVVPNTSISFTNDIALLGFVTELFFFWAKGWSFSSAHVSARSVWFPVPLLRWYLFLPLPEFRQSALARRWCYNNSIQ